MLTTHLLNRKGWAVRATALGTTLADPMVTALMQTHFVRDDFAWDGILELGEWAKCWNPPALVSSGRPG